MRRPLRISLWIVATICLLCIVSVSAVWIAGNTNAGRRGIERLTVRLTGGTVALAGLGGSFPASLSLAELELRDSRGVWLSAKRIALRWHPVALARWQIKVVSLEADELRMERSPLSDGKGSGSTSLPYIEVGRFSLHRVELGASLVGNRAVFSASGKLLMRSLDDAAADLNARRIDGQGAYDLHLRMDAWSVHAALELHEPANGPLENLVSLPGLGALAVSAKLDGPRSSGEISLTADAGDLHASVRGTLDLVHIAGDLQYSLRSPSLTPRPDVTWRALSLQGAWQGDLKEPRASGTLQVDGLRIANDTRVTRLRADLAASGGSLKLHAVADELEVPGSLPRLFAAQPFTVDATVALNDAAHPLDLAASHALLSLQGRAAGEGAGIHASWALKIPDVAPFAALQGEDVHGSATLNGDITTGGEMLLTMDGALTPTGGKAAWIAYAGKHPTLKLAGSLSSGALKIQTLRIAADALTASASATATRIPAENLLDSIQDIKAQVRADVSDLKMFSPALGGALSLTGSVTGPFKSMGIDAELSSRASLNGTESGVVRANLHARGVPSAPSGTLAVSGSVDGAPLNLDAAIDRNGRDSLRLLVSRGVWRSAHLEGDLTSDAQFAQSRGYLEFRFDDLADLNNLLSAKLTGSIKGRLALQPTLGHTEARLDLDGSNVNFGPAAGNLHLEARGPAEALGLRLSAQFPALYGAPASLTASAKLDLNAHSLDLDSVSADYRSEKFRLLAPAKVFFADGVSIDELKLGASAALLQIAGRLTPQLDATVAASNINSSLVNVFAPGLLSGGAIELRAHLQGTAASPTGSASLDANGLVFADDAATGLPPATVHAAAQLADGAATVKASLGAGTGSALTATGSVPLDAQGALDLKVGGKLQIGLINPLLEARGLRAAGTLDVDATITGKSAAPVVNGGIVLSAGSLRDYVRGVNLTDINAQISGNQGGLLIKTFTAKAASGTISISGTFEALQRGMPLDLHITAQHAQPVASNIFTATMDGDVHVSGTVAERLDVAGTIKVTRATIGIPDSLPPDVVVLDVRRRGQAAPATGAAKLVVGLAVTVDAPEDILVQGRGLDAELGGQIKVSGTTDDPQVNGGFALQRGSFSIAGTRLDLITPGSLNFDGAGLGKKIDPALDFKAQSVVNDVTVTVMITGVADAPRFDFTSSPDRPPDEIMALLLFGEPAAQLTALQIAQVGAALATLSGAGGSGSNPLVKIQKSLGLDRLSVSQGTTTTASGATESSGAAISAGRYINKRVYVEGKQSTTGTSQVEVDVDLTKHLKLQTRLGNGTATTQGTTPENDPGSSVGLAYQFEY